MTEAKVVLRDHSATARVLIGEAWHEGVPIVTARVHDDAQDIITAMNVDAVVLQENATHALVRIEGFVHSSVPIFKDDIRVRVHEIRERAPAKKEGGTMSRFFKKKSE